MKNCLILGTGRSGTSMLAGCLSKSGYFMGENLYAPRPANPKGFFEAAEINNINETLLAKVLPKRPPLIGDIFFRNIPTDGQRWLAKISLDTKLKSDNHINQRIKSLTSHTPFCFKDPRLSYTLPAWRPFLSNTKFLCIFREPGITVQSILKECKTAKYLSSLCLKEKDAFMVWILMYKHIIDIHRHEGDWLFLHYDQIISGQAKERVENFLEAKFDEKFPDALLKRTTSHHAINHDANNIYRSLCALAAFN